MISATFFGKNKFLMPNEIQGENETLHFRPHGAHHWGRDVVIPSVMSRLNGEAVGVWDS